MVQKSSVYVYKMIAIISVLLLLVCGFSVVGTAWGRYKTTEKFDLTYSVKAMEFLRLRGWCSSAEEALAGNWRALDKKWSEQRLDDGTLVSSMDFCISNGDNAQAFFDDEAIYDICVIGTLDAGPEKLQVILKRYMPDGTEAVFLGAATAIVKDSVLHHTVGDGWIYRFYDENGVELNGSLSGGGLTYQNYRLEVTGDTEACLLELQVSMVHSQR